MSTSLTGRLLSVNVARPRLILINGQPVETGIFKRAIAGRAPVDAEGVDGDQQADRTVHGGVDKAVYAYAAEDYQRWSAELGHECEPGLFGENLTTEGLDLSAARIGERWSVGAAVLEVSEPRQPCSKLGAKMGDPRFVRRFAKALRLGAYLRVIEAGELGAGDAIEVIERPEHDVSIQVLGRIAFGERELAAAALEARALSAPWREELEKAAASGG